MKFVTTKQKDNMAVIVNNPKGFKVIETSSIECFNWGGMAVCEDRRTRPLCYLPFCH